MKPPANTAGLREGERFAFELWDCTGPPRSGKNARTSHTNRERILGVDWEGCLGSCLGVLRGPGSGRCIDGYWGNATTRCRPSLKKKMCGLSTPSTSPRKFRLRWQRLLTTFPLGTSHVK